MRQPAFLDLSEPVGGNDLVACLGDWREVPEFVVVQRHSVFASLEEHTFHGGEVVLETVIDAGHEARSECYLEHPALKFHGVSVL